MQLGETQENKNAEISLNYMSNSMDNLKNVIAFIKQYLEITNTYFDNLVHLIEKYKPKSINIEGSDKKSLSFILSKSFFDTIQKQVDLSRETNTLDKLDDNFGSFSEPIKLYTEIIEEEKEKLNEKYKEAEQAKQTFFKEAHSVEDSLVKQKFQDKKLTKPQQPESHIRKKSALSHTMTLQNYSTQLITRNDTKLDIGNSNNNDGSNKRKTLTRVNTTDSFTKLKYYKHKYSQCINEYNSLNVNYNHHVSLLVDSITDLNKDCNQRLLESIQNFFMFIKMNNNTISIEIEKFFNQYAEGIKNDSDKLITDDLKKSIPITKLKEEQYKLNIFNQLNQGQKVSLTTQDVKNIFNTISGIIPIDVSEVDKIFVKTIPELETLTDKLVKNDSPFKEEKNLLYDYLKEVKYRYCFVNKIQKYPSNIYLKVSPERFKILTDLTIFILNESFKDKDYYSIVNILTFAQNCTIQVDKSSNVTKNLLKQIKKLPLFSLESFWCFVFKQSIFDSIQESPSKGVMFTDKKKANNHFGQVITGKIIFLFFIMEVLEIEKEITEKVFLKSMLPFHVGLESIKELYSYVKNDYSIKKDDQDTDENEETIKTS